jgi:maltose/moltooligosaccharide transporter
LNNDRMLAVQLGGGLMILAAIICYVFIKENRSKNIDEVLINNIEIDEQRSV